MAAKISMSTKRVNLFSFAPAIAIGVALVLCYEIARVVLALFDLQLTRYVLYTIYVIYTLYIVCTFLRSIVMCIKKVRQNRWHVLGAFLLICLLAGYLFLQFMAIAFGYEPVHVVKRNGEKFIAYSTVYLSTRYVNYYDYHGWFVCGKEQRIHESYDDGNDDPLTVDSKDQLRSAQYYNKDGSHMTDTYDRIEENNADGSTDMYYEHWHRNEDGSTVIYEIEHYSVDDSIGANDKPD